MPCQLFHNLTDADADAIVAYLRSLPQVKKDGGEKTTPVATPATPFALSVFPDTTLNEGDASDDHAAAEVGRYLLTSAAQCVRCHSPAVNGTPDLGLTKTFTGGAEPHGHAGRSVRAEHHARRDRYRRLDARADGYVAEDGRGRQGQAHLRQHAGRAHGRLRQADGRGRARHRRLPHDDPSGGERRCQS